MVHPCLQREPVSILTPEFTQLVDHHLRAGELAVLLIRYANCGGAKGYYLVRSLAEFEAVCRKVSSKTSLTAFFETAFFAKGPADDKRLASALDLLPRVYSEYEGIDVIRLDCTGPKLGEGDLSFLCSEAEIREWFASHLGTPILIGTLIFWRDNNDDTVTAYVPDADGVVRPGAY